MSNPFLGRDRFVRGRLDEPLPSSVGPNLLAELSSREQGMEVRSSRTSWVRRGRVDHDGMVEDWFVKTYDYPGLAPLRGALRNTLLRPSRAAREWDALAWLHGAGFAAPAPVAVLERRWFGFLRRAVLITLAWPGERVDSLMEKLPPAGRCELAAAVLSLVAALHQRGFRDRNLDLRNLLARREVGAWIVAKIDSPRWRLCPSGPAADRLAREDWDRLLPQLRAYVPEAAPPSG
jgi:hypothetical protein